MEANTKRESAFPLVTNDGSGLLNTGMALRDYFAAAVLQGFMANKAKPTDFIPSDDAEYCYRIADAMLKEREK